MAYLVYEYGCLPPGRGREAAVEQMRRRHRLWNALIEVEREYRSETATVLADEAAVRDVAAARVRLAGLRLAIKERRQAARKREVDVSDLQERISQAKIDLAGAIALERDKRRRRIAEHKRILESLETARRQRVRQAQADSDLYWCNYDDVIANYETARKRALKEGRELRFQSWDGTGKVTVRYQQGMPVAKVHGADKRLQIDPVAALAWDSPQRGVRRRLARSTVRIRVGSENRAPVWLELPVVLHRPMPDGGTIRSASVILENLGGRERWRLLVTVALPERPRRVGPAVAVDLGWRLLPEGLRVAFWEDEQGAHGELLLKPPVLWQFSKLNDLKAIQAQHMRTVLDVLGRWSKSNLPPDWMDLSHVSEWRKPWRLLKLHRTWTDRRTEGDAQAFDALTAWKERYDHLHAWEVNLRDQVIRHRKEVYRRFVSDLLRTHGGVFLEDFQIRSLARKDRPEDESRHYSGSMRVVAAVSLLARLLQERGGCARVAAPYTTQRCSWCGHTGAWDAAESVMHRCEGCGMLFDQDQNAARNILRRGLLESATCREEVAAMAGG